MSTPTLHAYVCYQCANVVRPDLVSRVTRASYTRRGETLNFSGTQIRVDRTPFGQMMVTVDLEEELFTLMIPAMRLSATAQQAELETIAVLSSHPSHKMQGQLQRYMTMCLSGTAENLSF